MNGIHDMGGMQDMGPIQRETREPVFHAEWERRVFALFNALGVGWPARRQQIELIPPADYLRMSYYERWLAAIGPLMVDTGMMTRQEIESSKVIGGTNTKWHVLSAAEAVTWIDPKPASKASPSADARFQAGQRVRARNLNPIGHTRLPRYVRGKTGTIEHDRGTFALQDTVADGFAQKAQRVYTVRFVAKDLWGEQANPRDTVYVDMWEEYLEPA
jgi:nitrile hydratase subunit beta